MEIKLAKDDTQIEFCKDALLAFRTNVKSEDFHQQVLRMMKNGYQIAYIENDDNDGAAAVIGFRIYEMLFTGTILYVDDLFTFDKERGKGYAEALLNYVTEHARSMGIRMIHLDSGFALHPAHRLYLRNGFVLGCHHFIKFID